MKNETFYKIADVSNKDELSDYIIEISAKYLERNRTCESENRELFVIYMILII